MRICAAVIGAGSWGTTVAHLLAQNTSTVLWARDSGGGRRDRAGPSRNERYLAGFDLHENLRATDSLADAVEQADLVVMGVPSHGFRSTLEQVGEHLRAWVPVVSLTKGLEQGSRLRMTEVINEVLPGHPFGVLTGPNLAKEIMAGDAAAAVLAMNDDTIAAELHTLFATRLFRVYTNSDVIGCEVAGALKNVIAIASGMADGLGTGDNTRAAVITRGLGELTRLGVAMGGEAITFSGLAGMGDLVATCISTHSRNRYVGEQLGRGRNLEEIIAEMHMVAEGVKTTSVVMELAQQYGVDMPIAEEVFGVLTQGRTAIQAYRGLLGRRYGDELAGTAEANRA